MNVIITEAAEHDLEAIADFIAQDSPRRAISYVHELLSASHAIAEFPQAFPLLPDYEETGLRRRSFGRYLIFYIVRSDMIVIERILNAAQNYEVLLFPDL